MHDRNLNIYLGRAIESQVLTLRSEAMNVKASSRPTDTIVKQNTNEATVKAFRKAIYPATSAVMS